MIKKFGRNILPKKKKDSVLKIFFNEFKDPIIILLLFATLASLFVGEVIDAIAIVFIILVDVIMSTYQENKANNTAEALSDLIKVKTKVIRNGQVVEVDSDELTVGDYVILESGDKISADMRITEAHNFMVDESILTGESIQISKNKKYDSNKPTYVQIFDSRLVTEAQKKDTENLISTYEILNKNNNRRLNTLFIIIWIKIRSKFRPILQKLFGGELNSIVGTLSI